MQIMAANLTIQLHGAKAYKWILQQRLRHFLHREVILLDWVQSAVQDRGDEHP